MHIGHRETHRNDRIGWLRAAILGANDGIVSTASLIVGVAAAHAESRAVLLSGLAGLVAGAMSMAAGEYVSVSSQADTEKADLDRERQELETDPGFEKQELANIYVTRGLDESLARKVAEQLMSKDALGAHARDELGILEATQARPIQAALASAASFAAGAILPLVSVMIVFAGICSDHSHRDNNSAACDTRCSWSSNRWSERDSRIMASYVLGIDRDGINCTGRILVRSLNGLRGSERNGSWDHCERVRALIWRSQTVHIRAQNIDRWPLGTEGYSAGTQTGTETVVQSRKSLHNSESSQATRDSQRSAQNTAKTRVI